MGFKSTFAAARRLSRLHKWSLPRAESLITAAIWREICAMCSEMCINVW